MKFSLPVLGSKNNEISCETCNGACCRAGAVISLVTKTELHTRLTMVEQQGGDHNEYMEYVKNHNGDWLGTPLTSNLRDNRDISYTLRFKKPCPALDEGTGKCVIYKKRPTGCRSLPVGSLGCNAARKEHV